MTDLNALPDHDVIAPGDQFLVRDKSDTTDGANGTDKFIDFSEFNPLLWKANQVKLVYLTAIVSGVLSDGWYYPDESTPTLTNRTAAITWEGTSSQIPAQGTGDSNFRIGDTAVIRSETL